MTIIKGILQGVEYDPSKVINGPMTPLAIVNHYTAGYGTQAARDVFNRSVVAAHIIIDRDGTILQMAPFDRRVNHAGPSKFKELSMLNNSSIGLEFVNIGFLKKSGPNYIDAYGGKYKGKADPADFVVAKNAKVGGDTYYWEPYTEAQIKAGLALTKDILDSYPSIKYIVTHEEIDTRGWKTDPGPAFPQDTFVALLNAKSGTVRPKKPRQAKSTTDGLNVRTGPGADYGLATKWPLYNGQIVELLSVANGWAKILINGSAEGYVNTSYLDEVW